MALATGDTIAKWSGWTAVESSGASVSAGAISAAASTECTSSNHLDAALLEVGAELTFSTAPTQDKLVTLLAKINTVDGTAGHDASVPTAAHLQVALGSAVLKGSGTTQYVHFGPFMLPSKEFDLYLYNGESTQAFTWKLYINPRTWTEKS